jgi:hypothetical protein
VHDIDLENPYSPPRSSSNLQPRKVIGFRQWVWHALWFCPIVGIPLIDWVLFEISRLQKGPFGTLLSSSEIAFVWNIIGVITFCWLMYTVWWTWRTFTVKKRTS